MTPLASALADRGWHAAVIDNRTAVQSPSAFLEHAVEQVPWRDAILFGHSGAGAFLPAIAARTAAAAAVFVDAILPPANAAFRTSTRFIEFLETVPTVDGQLAPWDQWWPAGTMQELIADDDARTLVVSEFPRVPRSFYDHQVEVASGWSRRPCCYLRLSHAYDEEGQRAATWGWPIGRIDGQHLDLIGHTQIIAEHVIRLVELLHLSDA